MKHKIVKVIIFRPTDDKEIRAESLTEADNQLSSLRHKAPASGYEKYDVSIFWSNDEKIKSRLDLSKKSSDTPLSELLAQMFDHYSVKEESTDEIRQMCLTNEYEGLSK